MTVIAVLARIRVVGYEESMPSQAISRSTREAELYPSVARWAQGHLGCFHTSINTGIRLGRIVVTGLRDIGGDFSGRVELIAIEVKAGRQPFATAAGQAHGYSVMADRCYLADVRTGSPAFSDEETAVASRLGIGLIALGPKAMREVLSAPDNEPIERLRLQVIYKMGYAVCSLCESAFARGDTPSYPNRLKLQGKRRGALTKAVHDEHGFQYWLYGASERDARRRGSRRNPELAFRRRFLCSDCVWALFRDALGDD